MYFYIVFAIYDEHSIHNDFITFLINFKFNIDFINVKIYDLYSTTYIHHDRHRQAGRTRAVCTCDGGLDRTNSLVIW